MSQITLKQLKDLLATCPPGWDHLPVKHGHFDWGTDLAALEVAPTTVPPGGAPAVCIREK